MSGMFKKKTIYFFIVFNLLGIFLQSESIKWVNLENGLEWKVFNYKKKEFEVDNIYILRINPNRFSMHLLTAKEQKHQPLSLSQWCKKHELIAGINASMYLPDRITSTGYMKNYNDLNNPRINKRFGAFIAFNPKIKHIKQTIIIDINSSNWKKKINIYNTIIQNYRIIDKKQKIVWTKANKMNSIASFGIDKFGNILFIMCQDRISTFTFAKIIQKLPVNIYNLTYLEGGHEASLFINHKNLQKQVSGKLFNSQRTDLFIGHSKLPNIIGIRKR